MATATIPAGQTYVDVSHGLSYTPTVDQIVITPQDDLGGRAFWPSDPGPTTFRINISMPDLADHVFSWQILGEVTVVGAGYCSKADVKAFSKISYTDLGYASDSAFDVFLDTLNALVESVIDTYCNVPSGFFAAGGLAFTNHLYDYRYPWIDLRYYPVISVQKVEYNDQGYGVAANWVSVTVPDYIINLDTGQLMLVNDVPATQEQSVRVSYTVGYSAIPGVVNHVAIQLASNFLHEILQRKISPVQRVDDFTLKLIVPATFTRELQSMLYPYIRRTVTCG